MKLLTEGINKTVNLSNVYLPLYILAWEIPMHVENAETPFSRRIKRSVRLTYTLLTIRL